MRKLPLSHLLREKRAEGKKHNQVVGALGRHLPVTWAMLAQDRGYEPPEDACPVGKPARFKVCPHGYKF